ncbi:hypothetical protein [Xanthobacter aminoxidans]|uniref:hypothetical protein n=1 Tax=Xanthobacter aminoxidans TaxID=186280 RepID=UPI002022BD93|nr:hypothetical protein [Xanthobacter aminoxidans]MCL8385802.1 hypothetical protein [Xanthobacter aminoxidans]
MKPIPHMATALTFVLGLSAFFLPPLAASSPQEGARQQANAAFETFRTKCGSDYVVAIDVVPPPAGGFTQTLPAAPAAKPSAHTIYAMYSDVRLDGREITSDVDHRNGIEWKGMLTYSAAAARQISVGKNGTRGKWSDWQPVGAIYTVSLSRKDGTWTRRIEEIPLLVGLGRYATLRRPSCSEVPAG